MPLSPTNPTLDLAESQERQIQLDDWLQQIGSPPQCPEVK